ncbi:SAM-dependent methyltransferase [Streptomyces sp. 4N509B]|uniref:SAM-dependent methyltransferase n=1 Tax=Streptomyces sp. 4N509B TaxID=3457413 RepID=UPI003FCF128F
MVPPPAAPSGPAQGPSGPGWVDTIKPHSARIYDFYLGGKDNYEADRVAAEQVIEAFPSIRTCARVNRAFMRRSTRMLAELGYGQWLDIGTGIPTQPNLHEIAQGVQPDARVVYVDNDPIVLAHAQALLTSSPEGATAYLSADLTEPETILGAAELGETLDLSRPVVLSLNAVLHFVPDEFDARGIVRRLVRALPSGSVLALTHCTGDFDPETWDRIVQVYRSSGTPAQVRSCAEVANFFTDSDLTLADPGLVVAHRWRPDDVDQRGMARLTTSEVGDAEVSLWAGVGYKP